MISIIRFLGFSILFMVTHLQGFGQYYLEDENFVFKNKIFAPNIHSVFLQDEAKDSQFPILNLNGGQKLTLRFDDLDKIVNDYSYIIVHCTPDWHQSNISRDDYITGYFEDNISDYSYSINTVQDFVHFSASFPHENMNITKSGNYALVVYKDFDKDQVVLIHQFYVVENLVKITPSPGTPLDFDKKYTHHEIDFTVNFSNINVTDVYDEFKTVVTQNNRLDNALIDLSPRFVNDKELIFDFDSENHFEAGNEFRTIDMRSYVIKGQGVKTIAYMDSLNHVLLLDDKKRAFKRYTHQYDNNGDYFINNDKRRNPHLGSDYAWTNFTLLAPLPLDSGQVYVFGRLTNWDLLPQAKMVYNEKLKAYEGELYLKQGVYDYSYLYVKDNLGIKVGSTEEIEGNFYQTENLYSIFIYHQQFEDNHSRLVGVHRLIHNR